MVYSGAWGKLIHEKTWSQKSYGTIPLMTMPNYDVHATFEELENCQFFPSTQWFFPALWYIKNSAYLNCISKSFAFLQDLQLLRF